MIKNITLDVDGIEITLTREQARLLWLDLEEFFGEVPVPSPSPLFPHINPWEPIQPIRPIGPYYGDTIITSGLYISEDISEPTIKVSEILSEADNTLTTYNINKCVYNG